MEEMEIQFSKHKSPFCLFDQSTPSLQINDAIHIFWTQNMANRLLFPSIVHAQMKFLEPLPNFNPATSSFA